MSNLLKCCCDSGCCASRIDIDFEIESETGLTADQTWSEVYPDEYGRGLPIQVQTASSYHRVVGTVAFICTVSGWSYNPKNSSVQYDPNDDLGSGYTGYLYDYVPIGNLPQSCGAYSTCPDSRVFSWTVTSDNTAIVSAGLDHYSSVTLPSALSSWLTSCGVTIPSATLYRVAEVVVDYDAYRQGYITYPDACDSRTDGPTGTSNRQTGTFKVAGLWGTTDICTAGTLIATWNPDDVATGTCHYPINNDTGPSVTTQDITCTSSVPIDQCCSASPAGSTHVVATRTSTSYLRSNSDGTFANFTTIA